jgi:hypothetical protein
VSRIQRSLQVAFRIIRRGYTLFPPLPPTDLTPIWGPPLVSVLDNPSAQEKLQTQAIELISTILVFDSSAISAAVFASPSAPSAKASAKGSALEAAPDTPSGREQEPLEVPESQPADTGWSAEWAALENAAGGYAKEHFHAPALWQALFLEAAPVTFPGLLTKAILWAASRLALLEEAVGLEPDRTGEGRAPKDWQYVVVEDGKKVANVVEAAGKWGKELVLLYRR